MVTFNENDVLLGRGGKVHRFIGNQKLKDLAHSHLDSYNRVTKSEKPLIAKEIVNTIQALVPPGRFLKRTAADKNIWEEVTNIVAIEKVCQVLRDIRRRLPSTKASRFVKDNKLRTLDELMKAKQSQVIHQSLPFNGSFHTLPTTPHSRDFLSHNDCGARSQYHNESFMERNSASLVTPPRQQESLILSCNIPTPNLNSPSIDQCNLLALRTPERLEYVSSPRYYRDFLHFEKNYHYNLAMRTKKYCENYSLPMRHPHIREDY